MILSTWPNWFPGKHQGILFKKDIENSHVSNIEYTKGSEDVVFENFKFFLLGFYLFILFFIFWEIRWSASVGSRVPVGGSPIRFSLFFTQHSLGKSMVLKSQMSSK